MPVICFPREIKNYKEFCDIIKPDAIKAKNHGKILDFLENKVFKIVAQKKLKLSQVQAEAFYDIHKDRPFFKDLIRGNRKESPLNKTALIKDLLSDKEK